MTSHPGLTCVGLSAEHTTFEAVRGHAMHRHPAAAIAGKAFTSLTECREFLTGAVQTAEQAALPLGERILMVPTFFFFIFESVLVLVTHSPTTNAPTNIVPVRCPTTLTPASCSTATCTPCGRCAEEIAVLYGLSYNLTSMERERC